MKATKLKQGVMAGFDAAHGSADRVRRMHMLDAGPNPCVGPAHIARYGCSRCGTESEWQTANTISEIRLGIPCPKCNPPNAKVSDAPDIAAPNRK